MKLKQIESEVFHLTEHERAELARKLILSLGMPTKEEIAEDWLLEASHRAQALDEGTVQPIPAEEVRKEAQTLLG